MKEKIEQTLAFLNDAIETKKDKFQSWQNKYLKMRLMRV